MVVLSILSRVAILSPSSVPSNCKRRFPPLIFPHALQGISLLGAWDSSRESQKEKGFSLDFRVNPNFPFSFPLPFRGFMDPNNAGHVLRRMYGELSPRAS